jgi:hypothetical protein
MSLDKNKSQNKQYHNRLHEEKKTKTATTEEPSSSDGAWFRCTVPDCAVIHAVVKSDDAGKAWKKNYHLRRHRELSEQPAEGVPAKPKRKKEQMTIPAASPEKKEAKKEEKKEEMTTFGIATWLADPKKDEERKIKRAAAKVTAKAAAVSYEKKTEEMKDLVWWECDVMECTLDDKKIMMTDENKRMRKTGHIAIHREEEKVKETARRWKERMDEKMKEKNVRGANEDDADEDKKKETASPSWSGKDVIQFFNNKDTKDRARPAAAGQTTTASMEQDNIQERPALMEAIYGRTLEEQRALEAERAKKMKAKYDKAKHDKDKEKCVLCGAPPPLIQLDEGWTKICGDCKMGGMSQFVDEEPDRGGEGGIGGEGRSDGSSAL